MWNNIYNIFRYGSPLWIVFESIVVILFLLFIISHLPLLLGKPKLNVGIVKYPKSILSLSSVGMAFTLMEQIIVLTSIFEGIKQNTVSLQNVQDNFIWSFYHPMIGLIFLLLSFFLYKYLMKHGKGE